MRPDVTYQAFYVPTMPNTGFEPVNVALLTFAAILVIAAGVFVFPYVRKTLTAIFK